MIQLASAVRLAPKTRLRFDRHTERHMLLYPERGLLLSSSAGEILAALPQGGEPGTAPRAVGAIVEELVARYGAEQRPSITEDVLSLLRLLAARGLVQEVEP